jgi:chromosome segregation ATPase
MLTAQSPLQEGIRVDTTNRVDHSIFMFAVLLGAGAELTEAVSRLRAEIDQAVREFNHFNRTLQQSAQEAIEAQGNVALEALDKSTKQYAQLAVRAVGHLENCFVEFNKQATELNTNTAQIATALQAFSKRIDDIEAPKDLLSEKLAPIFQRIAEAAEQTAGRVSSERQRNQSVAKLIARLEALTGSIEGVFDKVTEKEERVTNAIQHSVTVAGQTAELTSHVRQWTERFTEMEAKQAEIATALVQASEAARHRDTALDESLHKAFAGATSAIGEYETRLQAMLQTQAEAFESELQRAERAFTGLSRTLSEGATLLASELGRRN